MSRIGEEITEQLKFIPASLSVVQHVRPKYAASLARKLFALRRCPFYLQTDAYSGYHFTEKINEIVHSGCMAHARRPFAQLAKLATKEGLAVKALATIAELMQHSPFEITSRDISPGDTIRYSLAHVKLKTILSCEIKNYFINRSKRHI